MSTINPPVVAAFDLDGTLTRGGSVGKWLVAIGGRRRAYRSFLRLSLPLMMGALRSGTSADRAKERLFVAVLANQSWRDVVERSQQFADDHLRHEGRTEIIARLRDHLAQGHDVVVVSASPEVYVREIAALLGAHGAIGTRLALSPEGKLTGHYDGANCRGEQKLRRLRDWITQREFAQPPRVVAYGNSRGDLRMLRDADQAFNVGRLGRWGALRQLDRLS